METATNQREMGLGCDVIRLTTKALAPVERPCVTWVGAVFFFMHQFRPPTDDAIEAIIQHATSARPSPSSADGRPLRDTRTQLFVGNVCGCFSTANPPLTFHS